MFLKSCVSAVNKLTLKAVWLMALVFSSVITLAQDTISLYKGVIPNSRPTGAKLSVVGSSAEVIAQVTNPLLEIYLPEKVNATGAAVIICPGGSYKVLVYQSEGVKTAKEFAKNGIAAFVLKYRLPNDSTMIDKTFGPLQDAQQAISTVRQNASKWNIDVNKVGIMGFSAGGHLAATLATHFKKPVLATMQKTNLRPDFLILVYPVISMQDGITHVDSRTNLLGKNPSKETINYFSNDLQVDADTPPTYLTHAGDDKLVDVDNSILFYEQLRHHHVPAEMHLYPKGGHGFVLAQPPAQWMAPLLKWMNNSGLINK